MALTRKMLSAMDIPAEKVDEIISAHTETVNAIKEERDKFRDEAEALKSKERELQTANDELEKVKAESAKQEDLQKKYDDLKSEYDTFKADTEAKATKAAKEAAYRKLLVDAGVSERRIAAIMKVSDVDSVKLDDEGNVVDADKLSEGVKTEWADFIETKHEKGADVSNPPENNGGKVKEPSRAVKLVTAYRNEHYGNPTQGKED